MSSCSLPEFRLIKCTSLAKHVYDAGVALVAKFNSSFIPGSNHTCAELYVSPDAYKQCQAAAGAKWEAEEDWDEFNTWRGDDSWWDDDREWILAGGIAATLLILVVSAIFAVCMQSKNTQEKKKMSDLPNPHDLADALTLEIYKPNRDVSKATVAEMVDELHEQAKGLQQDLKLIINMRKSYLMSLGRLAVTLPAEINKTILHHAGLFRSPPPEKNMADVAPEVKALKK